MEPAAREAAEAFSHHQFTQTYDRLADDVRWRNMGGEEHVGRAAVVAACDASAAYLAGVRTTFTSSRTVVGTATVVIETTADYVEGDETSTVASCDLYDVVDGTIVLITSYAVDL
jgi:limonene-1,2-epoxide hydrolase